MKTIVGFIENWSLLETAYDDVKEKEKLLIIRVVDIDDERYRIILPLIQKDVLKGIIKQINDFLDGKKVVRGEWASEKIREKLEEEKRSYIG